MQTLASYLFFPNTDFCPLATNYHSPDKISIEFSNAEVFIGPDDVRKLMTIK